MAFWHKIFLFVMYLSFINAFMTSDQTYYENVALGKPSMQIDTFGVAVASRANDGNPSGNFAHKSCTETRSTTNTWWIVDLMAPYYIDAVRMKNRNSMNHGALRDFYIYVSETNPLPLPLNDGDSLSGEVCLFHSKSLPTSGVRFLPCDKDKKLRGRYLYVWKPGNSGRLTICEVEVLVRNPLRDFHISLLENRKSKVEPFYTELLPHATFHQCVILCLNMANADVDAMQLNKKTKGCSCFEVKPFNDTDVAEDVIIHESFDIIKRVKTTESGLTTESSLTTAGMPLLPRIGPR